MKMENLLKNITNLGELYNGDCIEIMGKIPDKSVDMIICDPPFGITRNSWDSIISLDDMWREYERIIKDNGAILVFSAQPFTSMLVMSNLNLFKYEWIWKKTTPRGFLNAKKMPLTVHETICVFYKKLPEYHPQMSHGHKYKTSIRKIVNKNSCYGNLTKDNYYNSSDRYPTDVLEISSGDQMKKWHPTQKPVGLYEYFIKTFSSENQTILDNCAGSGVLGFACENLNRKYVMIEKSKEYCDLIVKNLSEHSFIVRDNNKFRTIDAYL